jgi:hypothetical protein
MGLGKSTAAKALIVTQQPKRVLVITARRQQAHTALGQLSSLAFVHYNKVPPGTSLASVNRLIVQYESLHRLQEDDASFRPYDLVLIDEVRSVAGQIGSPTNKGFLRTNASIAKALLRNTRSLLMDADLEVDEMVKHMAAEIWTPEQIEVHRYTHVALPRHIATIMPLDEWMHSLKGALQAQKKVMVVFRSKRDLKVIIETLGQSVPLLQLQCFSSDSTEEEMEAFQRIDSVVERAASPPK